MHLLSVGEVQVSRLNADTYHTWILRVHCCRSVSLKYVLRYLQYMRKKTSMRTKPAPLLFVNSSLFIFRIREYEPQNQYISEDRRQCKNTVLAARNHFRIKYSFSNNGCRFSRLFILCSFVFFRDWHTHAAYCRTTNIKCAARDTTSSLSSTHKTAEHSLWELLNLGNRIKDCRRYGPSFVLTSATIVDGDTVKYIITP